MKMKIVANITSSKRLSTRDQQLIKRLTSCLINCNDSGIRRRRFPVYDVRWLLCDKMTCIINIFQVLCYVVSDCTWNAISGWCLNIWWNCYAFHNLHEFRLITATFNVGWFKCLLLSCTSKKTRTRMKLNDKLPSYR